MIVEIDHIAGLNVAVLLPTGEELDGVDDMLSLMVEASQRNADIAVIHESSLPPSFFDLRTKFAGEIAQKAVNYHFRLIIMGDFSKFCSKSLQDYIRESNSGKHVNFLRNMDEVHRVLGEEQLG